MKEWDFLNEIMVEKTLLMNKGQQFIEYALKLREANYVWGKENPLEADCSGTICFPLYLLGFDIRTTADVLFHECFTVPTLDWKDEVDLSLPKAVFYVTNVPKIHGGRKVDAGVAVHVTPVVGEYCVLHAGEKVKIMTAKAVRTLYEGRNCLAVWRNIDWKNTEAMSSSGKHTWGVDPVLKMFRK